MARRPTIRDVARTAGVSKATVGRVINEDGANVRPETAMRVREAITQLGYEQNVIAGSLRTNRTHMVAIGIPDITNPFWPEVARGIQDTMERDGYVSILFNSDWKRDRELEYLRLAKRHHYDGLILNPTHVNRTDLHTLGVPAVLLGGGSSVEGFDSVASNTHQGVLLALGHLHELGHRKLALIAGTAGRQRHGARYNSYVHFHAQRGIPLAERYVACADFSHRAGFDAARRLMDQDDPPTAILAANDVLASGAMAGLRDQGLKVPDDVSVVGMDDIQSSQVTWPPLTTIAKPKYQMGQQAAEYLIERMSSTDDNSPARRTTLPCTLVLRGSTSFPRSETR